MARIIICLDCQEKKKHKAKGLCRPCYDRQRYRGGYRHPQIICGNCGEEKPHGGKGLCGTCYCRLWRARNPEKARASSQRWRERHPDRARLAFRRWREKNLARMAKHEASRRARKAQVANTLTQEQLDFETNIARAMWPDEDLHLHHIVSLSKKGNHSWGNIMIIPASLNHRIGDKLPEEVYNQLRLGIN